MKKKTISEKKIIAGERTYFFDVNETSKGNRYLKITETQLMRGRRVRRPLWVFEDHIDEFAKAFKEALEHFKK